MTRRTNAQLLEENRELKKALEDRDSELISWATYQRDFQNRWALHADEWHKLYMIDCPQEVVRGSMYMSISSGF